MRVVCIKNTVGAITESVVRERVFRAIRLEGPLTDLAVGREYPVQAMELREGGLWLYLHTVPRNDFPYPYPAEIFDFRDSRLPMGWSIRIETEREGTIWKRITFDAWSADDQFYERLVDGHAETVSVYRRLMARDENQASPERFK